MKKVNMRKKLLATLLAVSGISGINDGNLLAIKTMRQYEQPGKPLSETVPPARELDFNNIDPKNLKTPDELKRFLNENKFEIFYAYESGKSAQQEAYNKAKEQKPKFYRFLNMLEKRNPRKKVFRKLRENTNRINEISSSDHWTTPTNAKIDGIMSKALNNHEKWAEKSSSFVQLLSIDENKSLEQNWNNIGRGILNKAAQRKDKKKFLKTELECIEAGDINCTGWATVLHWFLNQNNMPAQILYTADHWEVCVALTNSKRDELRLYTINIGESIAPTIDSIEFVILPLADPGISNQDEWKTLGTGPDYDDDFSTAATWSSNRGPLQPYLDHIDKSLDPQLHAWLRGLQTELRNLEENKKIKTNLGKKRRTYAVQYLPHEYSRRGIIITIPLNVDRLGKPILNNEQRRLRYCYSRTDLTFASLSDPEKPIRWVEGQLTFTHNEWKKFKNGYLSVFPSCDYDRCSVMVSSRDGYDMIFNRDIKINVNPGDNVDGFWIGNVLTTIPEPAPEPAKSSPPPEPKEFKPKKMRQNKIKYG